MRIFTVAAIAFGMTMAVSCNKDPEDNGGGNGGGNNGGNGGNTENLPTTIDENFNNGLPSTWTAIDADGDGYNWVSYDQSWFATNGTGEPFGTDGSNCMVSASFINGINELNTDNYLVMPKLYIEDGSKLTYKIGSYQAQYADSYEVVVGTMANGAFTITKTLLSEVASSGYSDGNGLVNKTIDLSELKGQSVYIAFRHHCTDCYWIILEDVKVAK